MTNRVVPEGQKTESIRTVELMGVIRPVIFYPCSMSLHLCKIREKFCSNGLGSFSNIFARKCSKTKHESYPKTEDTSKLFCEPKGIEDMVSSQETSAAALAILKGIESE